MKKILILGLLLVSHLWGLKKWSGGITDMYYNCTWCKTERPKLPDDYKPQKGDMVIKVKVGNVEGEIVAKETGNSFIKSNQEKSYKYFGTLSEIFFFIDYPNYTIMPRITAGKGGSGATFYQIFAVDDRLEMFELDTPYISCDYCKDSPCPLTKEYILDWIKKQGGQEYFDYACPQFYDNLNDICDQGIIRGRRDGEYERRDRITG